jgi:ATP/maltotriose-dependent transcriptional regulator MalT
VAAPVGLIRAWLLLMLMYGTAGRHGLAEKAALSVIQHARAIEDRTHEVRILPALAGVSLYGPTRLDVATDRCRELLSEVAGDHKAEAMVCASLAHLEAMGGNFEEARRLYRRSRAMLEEFGWRLLAALTSIDSGPIELLAGDAVAAEAELRRDFDTLQAMGERNYIATTAAYLAFALILQERYEEANDFVRFSQKTAAPDDLTAQYLWRQFRARLLSRGGVHDQAVALARRAVELTDQTEEPESQGNARLDLADVLAAAGEIDEAKATLSQAIDRFEQKGIEVLVQDVRRRLGALDALDA